MRIITGSRRRRHRVVLAAAVVLSGLAPAVGPFESPAGASGPPAGVIVTVAGGDGPSAASATALRSRDVAVAGGFAYVADEANNVVRRIDLATGAQAVVAGTGVAGFSGDGGPATEASLDGPSGVAIDGVTGDLYIADRFNLRVRKVAGGTITTVAGNGTMGSGGNGGPATNATLTDPVDVAVDPAGTLYISDTGANQIRAVTAGTITTFAGAAGGGFNGDGIPAVSAQLNGPNGIAAAGTGVLYIADAGNARVRLVSGGIITTVAGNGTIGSGGDGGPPTAAQLVYPTGVAIDGGTLVIADALGERVRQVSGGIITTLAGTGSTGFTGDGGPATSATFSTPAGVALSGGDTYIADQGNRRIRKISGGTISTFAGTGADRVAGNGGPATAAQLAAPAALAADGNGNLYVADRDGNQVRRIAPGGTITLVAGNGEPGDGGDGGPATAARLNAPTGVAVDAAGTVYIADTGNHRVRKVSGGTITTVIGTGIAGFSGDGGPGTAARLSSPAQVALLPDGALVVADTGNNRLRRLDTAGVVTTYAGGGTGGDGTPATLAALDRPVAVVADVDGDVFFAERFGNSVRRIAAGTQTLSTVYNGAPIAGSPLLEIGGLALDGAGRLYASDVAGVRVVRLTGGPVATVAGDGVTRLRGDGGPATAASFGAPLGLVTDHTGDLFVADAGAARVRRIGMGLTPTAPGAPSGVTAAPVGGGAFVSWNPPTNSGGAPVTAWVLTASPGGATLTVPAGTTSATLSGLTNGTAYTIAVAAQNAVGTGPAATSPTVVPRAAGRFHPITPARLVDSRNGTGGYSTPWGGGSSRAVTVAGTTLAPAVPASATGVVLNVTAVFGTAPSHLTVWPTGRPQPVASNVNFTPGRVVPNLVTVAVGTGRQVSIFNNAGSVDVVVDVVGWFDDGGGGGSGYNALVPARILDSRDGTGGITGPWGPGQTRNVQVRGVGGVPPAATAVVMNVTVDSPSAASHLTVWPSGVARPTASNLNFTAGLTVPNLVVAAIGADGRVSVFNNAGTVHVIADVVGYFGPTGDGFGGLVPTRVLDTRDGTGELWMKIGPGQTREVRVTGVRGIPPTATAVVLNVTSVFPSQRSFLTAWPAGVARPFASNLNYDPNVTIANAVVVKVGAGGRISLFNNSGSTDVVVDVVGWFG